MPSSLRSVPLLVVLAVLVMLAAGCQNTEPDEAAEEARGAFQEFVDRAGQTLQELLGEAEEQLDGGGDGDQSDGPGAAEPGAGGDGDQPGAAPDVAVPDDQGQLGSACRPYLRGQIPGMVVEVAHQQGAAPQSGALDHLVGTLQGVVDKPAGVRLAGPSTVPGDGRTWTADELRAFAAEHRTQWSSADQAAMYVLAVRGEFEQQGVLGVAISATEMVIFPDNIGGLATGLLGGRQAVERAVLVHEAGHLLCLVNIGYDSAQDHEDPEHPRHSVHKDSVMHWAIETDAITQVFSGPPPSEFHPDDRADLKGLREGRY